MGGDPEHFPGTLAVAGCNQRGMSIDEAVVVEKLMDGKGRLAPNPEYSGEGVGPGPQMGDGAQIFQGVTLFLKRVVRGGSALQQDLTGVDLEGLLGFRGEQEPAADGDGAAYVIFGNLIL